MVCPELRNVIEDRAQLPPAHLIGQLTSTVPLKTAFALPTFVGTVMRK
jgi:hypothetical protein